jgi:anti-sigma factor RsiW
VSNPDLPCNQFVELATDYLEGALSVEQRLVVERHLALCAPCGIYLDQMRAVITTSGRLREEDVPTVVMKTLVTAFRELHGDCA